MIGADLHVSRSAVIPSAFEQGEGFGDVGVVPGGQVLRGEREVVVRRDADAVDELVAGAQSVLGRKVKQAAVVEPVSGRVAGHDARGPGADQGAQPQVLQRAAERVARRDSGPRAGSTGARARTAGRQDRNRGRQDRAVRVWEAACH